MRMTRKLWLQNDNRMNYEENGSAQCVGGGRATKTRDLRTLRCGCDSTDSIHFRRFNFSAAPPSMSFLRPRGVGIASNLFLHGLATPMLGND